MENEFGVLAGWTADAVRELGEPYAVPAACKGSASPAALSWLGQACELREGLLLADVGGGMGGPAAYAAQRYGVRPLVVEPMVEACRAAAGLFGVPALAAGGERLPLGDSTADAVWCLGVLCTTPDKPALLAEIARVLKPGGAAGFLVFTADTPRPAGAPEGNEFPSVAELPRLLEGQGLRVREQRDLAAQEEDHPDVGPVWRERAQAVQDLVSRSHEGDPRLAEAQDQEQRIGRLLKDGVVRGTLVLAVLEQ